MARRVRAWMLAALVAGLVGCNAYHGARLYQQGTRALDRGDAAGAVTALEAAARRAPRASEVHNHLGLAYQAAGRPGDARLAFEHALELDCDNAAARANLRAVGGAPVGAGPAPSGP